MSNERTEIKRFSRLRSLEHHVGALLFIILVVTGLAQRFHSAEWSRWVISFLGGIDSSRLIHRYAGLVFALVTLLHIAIAITGVVARGWRPSMVITRKDFRDALTNIRYYLGIVDQPAQCDRFDYKQKFEYWGVLLGGILMIATGFILWYPVEFFRQFPFLPGQIIPAAKAAHANEAMLALLVIVVWHIYNAVFSPEVFPLDTTIFTGRISRERMIHEHPIEYKRIMDARRKNQDTDPSSDKVPREGATLAR